MLILLVACGESADSDEKSPARESGETAETAETGDTATDGVHCNAEVLLSADESAPGNWTILAEYAANPDPGFVVSGDPVYTLVSCTDGTGADCTAKVSSPQAARWDFVPDHADTYEITVSGAFVCAKVSGEGAGASAEEIVEGTVGFAV